MTYYNLSKLHHSSHPPTNTHTHTYTQSNGEQITEHHRRGPVL